MAALDFPSSPTNGQVYSANGKSWTYNSATSSWLSTAGTMTTGYIPFGNGTSTFASSANLFWDNTNNQLELSAGSAANPSFSYTGGSTVGMFFPAANTLAFSTNSTERMRIDSAGRVGIGTTTSTTQDIWIGGNSTGNVTQYGVLYNKTTQSDVTGTQIGFTTSLATAAAAFTLSEFRHFSASFNTIGAGSTVTNQYGFYASSGLTGATNNYGFYSNIASATGRWNFYAAGTADNYFAGNVGIGAAPRVRLEISGASVTTAITNSSGAADTKTWDFTTSATNLSLRAVNDAYSAANTAYLINRSGYAIGAHIWYVGSSSEAMRIGADGTIGIAAVNNAAVQINLGGTMPSSANTSYSVNAAQTVPSTSTTFAVGCNTSVSTAAAAFTCAALYHFAANQGTIGAGSAVTNQYGYFASSNLTGATNNFGFYSNIASGTGRYNFFANGTAANYFGGKVGIGVGAQANVMFQIGGTVDSSSNTSYPIYVAPTIPAASTSGGVIISTAPSTAAAAFTCNSLTHFAAYQGTIGAGSAVTNQYGFVADPTLVGATNNYGFYSNIPAGTGDWNFYANGTAANYFAGDTGIGIAPDGTQFLHIAAGTTAKAPLELTAGTNMTTVDPGSIEYDGTCLYFTPFSTSRGVVPGEQLLVLGATNTLTSQTGAQPLFDNATANGRVDLAVGTYWFECGYSLTSMSGTTQTFGFALVAGTAVIGSQGWRSLAAKAALATGSTCQTTYSTAANTALTPNSTSATGHALISGFIRITTAGTIVPSVSLGVAAAAVVGVQSYFRIFPISSINAAATNITVGNWS